MDKNIKHPDVGFVKSMIESIIKGKRLRDVKIETIDFDLFSHIYCVGFSWNNYFETIQVPSELIDDILRSSDPFKARKIKSLINDAINEFQKEVEENK